MRRCRPRGCFARGVSSCEKRSGVFAEGRGGVRHGSALDWAAVRPQVWDPERVVIIPDHYIFTSDPRANRNVDILRCPGLHSSCVCGLHHRGEGHRCRQRSVFPLGGPY